MTAGSEAAVGFMLNRASVRLFPFVLSCVTIPRIMKFSQDYFETLFEISGILNSSLDPTVVLESAMDQVIRLTGAERGFIMLVEEGSLRFQVARNLDQETVEGGEVISRTLVHRVLETGKSELTLDALSDPDLGMQKSVIDLQLRSVICVPLRRSESVIGVLYVDNRVRGSAFTSRDVEVLEAFANSAAIAIENARLYLRLKESYEERLQLQAKVHEEEKRAVVAEETARLREELAHYIVHDLKNPLTVIIGNLSLLHMLLENQLDDESKQMISTTLVKSGVLDTMITSILDVYKLENGEMPIQKRTFNLCEVIGSAVEDARPLVVDDVDITCQLETSPLAVQGDPELVRRVLMNLLGNAAKFTRRGTISVCADRNGNDREVLVRVSDTGCGIKQEYIDRIFEKFVQLESKKRGERASSGLGLTFCKLVVEQLAGRIWAESSEGAGSSFFFTLPAVE